MNETEKLLEVWGIEILSPHGINDLTQAVKDNNIDLVRHLLDLSTIDINQVDNDFFTPLQLAVKHGHYDIVKLLLENEADTGKSWYGYKPTRYDSSRYNPLQIAVDENDIQMVKLLLSYEAPFGDYDNTDDSVCSLAARNNNIQILNMLYDAGVSKSDLEYAFSVAIREHKFELVKWLLERGCSVHEEEEALFNALGCIPLMELLLDHGASFEDISEFTSCNVIQEAVSKGELEVLQWMIEKKGVVLSEEWNLFHHAVGSDYRKEYFKFIEIVQFLEEQRLILDQLDEKGYKPIHYAAKYCTPSEVNYFLSKGCDISEKTSIEGYNLMHLAVIGRNLPMFHYLVEKGFDINEKSGKGYNLMHLAIINYNLLAVEFLIKKEFNFDTEDSKGNKPLYYIFNEINRYYSGADQIRIKALIKLIIGGTDLQDNVEMLSKHKGILLDNCKLSEKVTVLTNLIHAFYSLDHSDTAKIMHSLEKAQSDIISYLHKKTFDRREQIKLCEEIEQFQSKAKLIELIKPQIESFHERIEDIKDRLKESDDDILGTLIESISAGLVSESKLGNKIREFLPGPEKSMYAACLLTKKAFLSAEEKYKLRIATDTINFHIKKLKKANKELKSDSINKEITQLEDQFIGIKNTFIEPSNKKFRIDSDHIEALDPQVFDKLLEIGIIGDGDQGNA